jgi:hypothetical protein
MLIADYKQTGLSIEAHLERSITLMASVMTVPNNNLLLHAPEIGGASFYAMLQHESHRGSSANHLMLGNRN